MESSTETTPSQSSNKKKGAKKQKLLKKTGTNAPKQESGPITDVRFLQKDFWPIWFMQTLCVPSNPAPFYDVGLIPHVLLDYLWSILIKKATEISPDMLVLENASKKQVNVPQHPAFTRVSRAAFPGHPLRVIKNIPQQDWESLTSLVGDELVSKRRAQLRLYLQFRSMDDIKKIPNVGPARGIVKYMLGNDGDAFLDVVDEWDTAIKELAVEMASTE